MRRLLLIVAIAALLLSSPYSAWAQAAAVRVYYAGPAGGLATALSLAKDFQIVSDPSQADVFVLNGQIPDVALVASRVRAGAGLLLIGPDATLDTTTPQKPCIAVTRR